MDDCEEFPDRDKELIDWDEDQYKAFKGQKLKAKHGSVTAAIRSTMSQSKICSLFCGGKRCKFDSDSVWKKEDMEVKGIYSNWVTDNILAMARPNTECMEKHHIISQFKNLGITTIINLQLPGEHAHCGNGLDSSGFSYNPQTFMDNDVFFYNFGWDDFGVGSLSNILDMVKVMQFAVSEGKVAIHCHAGLGRTGVLIACYLVFANRIDPKDAIHYVRSRRHGAIQTKTQVSFVQQFASYLAPLRIVFSTGSSSGRSGEFSLSQFLLRQKLMLHGYEARALQYIPKILFVCCERLLQLADKGPGYKPSNDYEMYNTLINPANDIDTLAPPTLRHAHSSDNLPDTSPLHTMRTISLESFTPKSYKKRPASDSPRTMSSMSSYSAAELRASDGSDTGSVREAMAGHSEDRTGFVVDCMSETQYSVEVMEAVRLHQRSLNEDVSHYRRLAHETDPLVLSALMWEWLDQLKEPLLHPQDLPDLLSFTSKPLDGLHLLDKGSRHTIKYLAKVIARAEPLTEDQERNVLQRMLSTLTHQNMVVEYPSLASTDKHLIRRTTNKSGNMRDNLANKLLYFYSHLVHVMCQKLNDKTDSLVDDPRNVRTLPDD